jgi:hypothetical protein
MTDRDKGQILQWWQGCRRGCEPRLSLGSRSQVFSAFLAPRWFWVVATSVLCVSSISSTPTAAYGHYAERDDLSSLMVTIIYSVYAIGIVASLAWASAVGEGSAALRTEHQYL